jgi:hypothetical protein
MNMRTYQSINRMYFRTDAVVPSTWVIRAKSKKGSGASTYEAKNVVAVAGSRIILTYDKWAGAQGAPSLWLDEGADGSLDVRIPFRKV